MNPKTRLYLLCVSIACVLGGVSGFVATKYEDNTRQIIASVSSSAVTLIAMYPFLKREDK